jgi:hypothetical protein
LKGGTLRIILYPLLAYVPNGMAEACLNAGDVKNAGMSPSIPHRSGL